jgi:hypothetical protein
MLVTMMTPLAADAAVKSKTLTITAKSVKHGMVTVPKGKYLKIVIAKGAAGAKINLKKVTASKIKVKGSKNAEMTTVRLKGLTLIGKLITKTNTNISAASAKSSIGTISVRGKSTVKVNTPVEKIQITDAAKGTTGTVNRYVGTIICAAENVTLNVNAAVGKIVIRGKNVAINIKDGVSVGKIVSKATGTTVNGEIFSDGSSIPAEPVTDASGEPTEPDEDRSTVNPDGNVVPDTDETGTVPSDIPETPKTDTSNSNTPTANTSDSSNTGNTPAQEKKPSAAETGSFGSNVGDEVSPGSTDDDEDVVTTRSVTSFEDLKSALESEIDDSTILEIHVADSFQITGNLTIPKNKTVVLDDDVELSLDKNVVLTVGDKAILRVSSDLNQFIFADDGDNADESAGKCGIITSGEGKIDAGDFSLTNANVYQDYKEDLKGNKIKMLHFASNKEEDNVYLCIEGSSEENILNVLNNYSVQEDWIEVKIGEAAPRLFPLEEDGWDREKIELVKSYTEFKDVLEDPTNTKNIVISESFTIPETDEVEIPAGRKILFGKDITVKGTLNIPSFDEIYFLKSSGIIVSGTGAVCSDNITFSHAKLHKIDAKDKQIHIESLNDKQEGEVTVTGEKTEADAEEGHEEPEDKILDLMRDGTYFLSSSKVKIKVIDNTGLSETEQEYIVNGGSLAAINKTYLFSDITKLKNYLDARHGIGLGSGSKIVVDRMVLFGPDNDAVVSYQPQPSNNTENNFIAYVFTCETDTTQNDSINNSTQQIVINYNDNACTIPSSELTNGRGSISFGDSEKILVYSEWDGTADEDETYSFPNEAHSDTKGITSLKEYLDVGGLIIGKGSKIVVDDQILFGADDNAIIQYQLQDGTDLAEEETDGAIVGYISFMHGYILINYNATVCKITNLPDRATSGYYLFEDEVIIVHNGFDSYEDTDEEWDVEQEE